METKIHDIQTNQADKVDKMLVKNLLIGYIVSSSNKDKSQILKLISSVLDFNQNETDKVGITKSQNPWFTGGIGASSSHGNRCNHTKIFFKLHIIHIKNNHIFELILFSPFHR